MEDDLKALEIKIKNAKHQENTPTSKADIPLNEGMNEGLRAGIEFVTAIAGGTFIGWLLDYWLGTLPLFLISMFFLGTITGFVNIYRLSQNLGASVGYSQLHNEEKNAKTSSEKEKQ